MLTTGSMVQTETSPAVPPAVIAGSTLGAVVGGILVIAAIVVFLRHGPRLGVVRNSVAMPMIEFPPPSAPADVSTLLVVSVAPMLSAPPEDPGPTMKAAGGLHDDEDPVTEDP